ncbi:TfoX/Sxy family protein [Nocardioides campestrisoli]|uniref:TfoX/Sxy family protein n=1 Tax=Nocardioides campestrisoli TaxID=2736757 RepID=UPI0015E6B78B|nr:TfoX/Sxy family protein [Nocardioides campestrisoli]
MSYDEELAERVRDAVNEAAGDHASREIKMFGGLCWTVNTHMAVGCGDDDLMVHVGTDGIDDALARGARRATMGERTMGGVVLVSAADLPDDASLRAWVAPAVERAVARPPKPPKSPRPPGVSPG